MASAAALKKLKEKKTEDFIWKGVNKKGIKVSGQIVANSQILARQQLRNQGINPTSVRKKKNSLFSSNNRSINSKDIAVISRQLATMLSAGVAIMQSIELIAKGTKNKKIRDMLAKISHDLQAGSPFHQVLRQHPLQFDDLYCDLVEAGEQSGSLESIYDRIATYKEKAESLKSKIKKAMTYPIAVLSICMIVTVILLVFVVPQFKMIFDGFGAELPAFTQIVIGLSEWIQVNGLYLLAGIVVSLIIFIKRYKRSRSLRDRFDGYLLKLPIVGSILHKAALARFSRILATTFTAGVPLIDALDSAAGASGNAVYRKAILNIKSEVSTGTQINIAMQNTRLFPEMVVQMVQIGEESGAIDDMLNKVASIYEEEVDDSVDNLSSLIEPIIMSILGVLIGGLIVAMYLPIFDLGKIIK